MCETIFKLSYMYFLVIFAFSFSTLINIHIFEISEMTTQPTMTPTFESAMLSFSPGVNSRAELVTLAPGLRPERASRRWLGESQFCVVYVILLIYIGLPLITVNFITDGTTLCK